MQIDIEKRDLEDLISRLSEGEADEVLYRGMEALGNYGLPVAKKNTPVSTGQLRRGWYIARLDSSMVVLKNPVSYAEYVEYGHRQEPGRYVPKLGKKLKASWCKGVFYARRSEETIRKNADYIIKPVVTEELEKIING